MRSSLPTSRPKPPRSEDPTDAWAASGPPALLALGLLLAASAARAVPAPHHDRVVVVVMGNKCCALACALPYTASLIRQGATSTSSFAVLHPSQPDYLAPRHGNTLGITNDNSALRK